MQFLLHYYSNPTYHRGTNIFWCWPNSSCTTNRMTLRLGFTACENPLITNRQKTIGEISRKIGIRKFIKILHRCWGVNKYPVCWVPVRFWTEHKLPEIWEHISTSTDNQ